MEREVAVVTGASRGIGRAIARALGEEGMAVGLLARSADDLAVTADGVREAGGEALVRPCDVTDREGVFDAFEEVRRALGPVGVLVHDAGVATSDPWLEIEPETWREHFAVNVDGAYHCTQAALPDMLERERGRIVTVASVCGRRGFPFIGAYVASKHALVGLTRAIAAEYATRGITANAVCPGYVDTTMTDRAVRNIADETGRTMEEARDRLRSMSPQRRIYAPDEVAEVVRRLASDGWSGVNGQAIPLDGGQVQA